MIELLIGVVLPFGVAGLIGWVMNISTIIHSTFTPFTGELAVRIIGVFISPIGMVMGYF